MNRPGDKANTQQQLTCYGGHKLLCMPQHNVMFMHVTVLLYRAISRGRASSLLRVQW